MTKTQDNPETQPYLLRGCRSGRIAGWNMRHHSKFMRSQTSDYVADMPLPPLVAYQRCTCGICRECQSNARWDQVFAKFEVKKNDTWPTKGLFQSTLRGW
jgi:hypothetical protein